MSFNQFVALLEYSTAHFTQLESFGDPFEGTLSRANLALTRPSIPEEQRETFLRQLIGVASAVRRQLYANCWYAREHESAAMWSLYSRLGEGVAIKSSIERLQSAFLPTTEEVFLGDISYIDYVRDAMPEGNMFYWALHKRLSYEHEREVRALIWPFREPGHADFPSAVDVKIDVGALIERIYVAPQGEPWFRNLVQAVVERYGFAANMVEASDLDARPLLQ